MSHDKNGTPIKAGDLVVVECKVVSVTPDQDYCNVTLESTLAMPMNGVKTTIAAINAKQVLLTQKVEE